MYLDLSFFNELQQMGAGGDFAQAYVIAHEVGHAIDDDLGDLSSTEGFKTVYQTYGGLFGSYAATSQKEFFAELYLQYLCNASQLNKYYPQLYQYMEAVTAMVS